MIGKKTRKIYVSDTKHSFRKKYLLVFISIILTFSLFLLLWSNDLKIESKTASLSFGWLWHSNKSTLVEQMAQDAITGSVISIPVNGLVDNMMRIEDDFCINPHKFKYILNPKSMICDSKRKDDKPLFLVYIHSAPHHYARRMLIRETWGSQSNFEHLDIRTIFMCGAANNSNVQAALELEFDRYGDVVQEDFVDSYRNLTHKAIMALRWVSQNCQNAKLILKADDDIFINIFKLVPHLESILKQKEILREPTDRMIICNVWTQMKVIRDPNSKWYVSREEIPDDYFKTYCSGSLYAFTPGLAGSLFEVSRHVPFFWVDDYYVTGMLPEKMQESVSYESINKFYFLSASEFMNKFGSGDGKLVVGHAHNINNWKQVWSLISANTKRSARHNPRFAPAKGTNTQHPPEHSSLSFVKQRT